MPGKGKGGEVEVRIVGNDEGLEKTLNQVKGKAEKALGTIGKVAGGTAKAIGVISGAVIAAGAAAVNVGMDFESAFAKVRTIMDPTQKSFEDMQTEIIALSEKTGIAASALSESVYNAISATGDTAHAVALVESATKLAKAGFTDTESALGVITTAMNAYGLSAEQALAISDSLIATQNLGVTTIAELSGSMGKAIASASAYGIDLYNVEAAYVAMTKSGISTAESTTYMSSMFKELGDSGSKVSKILQKETGKSFADLMAEGKSLGEVLGIIYEATGDDVTALMNLWGSAEAGKASNAIINQGLEAFDDNLGRIRESAGATEAAFETMQNTVEAQAGKLMNTIRNLGIAIYSDYQGELADIISEAGGWLEEISQAYNTGGVDAMGDAIGNVAPKMINKLTDMLTKVLSGVAQKLPGLVKNLLSALPNLFGSIVELAPKLVDAIFNTLSTAVEEIIPMIPQLFMKLFSSLPELIGSVLNGVAGVVDGIFNGVEQAFHAGYVKLASGHWADESEIKHLDYTLDIGYAETGVTAAEIVQNVETAKSTIETALSGVEGIDASSVAEHVIAGDVTAAIEAALLSAGVDEGKARAAADSIKAANETISNAVSELGLTDEQAATLKEMAANGATKADIEAYLTSCEIDQTAAETAAESIDTSRATMATAIGALPEEIGTAVSGIDFTSDKAVLVGALTIMQLDEADIQPVLDSYETAKGLLTAGVGAIFTEINTTLTDGKVDTEADISGLKGSVEAWAESAYTQIDEWYAAKLKELRESGKSGAELQADLDDAAQKYTTMRDSVAGVTSESISFVDTMAGKSTAYVQAHLDQLEEIKGNAIQIASEIDALTGTLSEGTGETAYRAVKAGATTDEAVIQTAISFTFSDYKLDTDAADEVWKNAKDELLKEYEGKEFDEAFEERMREINKQHQERIDEYTETFEGRVTDMVGGIADAVGIGEDELRDALTTFNLGKLMQGANVDVAGGVADSELIKIADLFDIDPNDEQLRQKLRKR